MEQPLGVQIPKMLQERGVTTVFGIPGVHNQELYRGLDAAGITHVLARHEQGAGFMADGYARASGRPGVAFVISGPGLTNIMTPMGQAYSDSVPMLVISSCLAETAGQKGQLHQMKDQRAAAACVCDWSEEATTPQAVYALIDRAMAEFKSGRARPKHIQVPIPVLQALAPPPPRLRAIKRSVGARRCPGLIEPILAARRPLFIFGGGAVACRDPARDVLRKLGAAAFETYAGRGIAGPSTLNFGSFLARPGAAEVISSADVVVLVGTELAETDTWREEAGIRGTCIQVDIDPAAFHSQARLAFHGSAERFLDMLLDCLDGHAADTDWTEAEIHEARARWRREVDAERPGIVPLADALRQVLSDQTAIYSDMTQFAYGAKEVWPMAQPGLWHHPTGFGTLGYALPAAIGGALARPDRPTMAIAGDYGLQYTLPELGTAVELGLGLPILLWDNSALGEIADSMTRAQIAPTAVTLRNPDFLALARSYGADAAQPGTLDALADTVQDAFRKSVPTLIRMTPAMVSSL